MINYNSSNLSQNKLAAQSASTSDERYGCRALICDSNGIIIGETAYRCMICSHINDSIAEIKQHYYENHSNEILLGPSANLSNSLNPNSCATNGGGGVAANSFLTNSILNNSLNSSLNNGLQFSSNNSFHNQSNSNSLLNNETLSAKKRKNVADVLEKIYGTKNVINSKSRQANSTSLIQSTGSLNNLSNYLNAAGQKERDLFNLNSQLSNQLNSLSSLNNLANLNNQLQLANEEYDEDDLDDQKSDADQDDWMMRTNNNSIGNLGSLSNDLLNANSTIIDAISKTSLYLKLNENMNDNLPKEMNSKSKSSKSNNLFVDNSLDPDSYSNTNIYENMMNLSNDSDTNKDDLPRNIPLGK